MPEDLIVWASDPEAKDAYPIVTYTWLLCYKQYQDKKKFEILQDVLQYCLTDGQKESESLGYLPLPPAVVEKVSAAVRSIKLAPNAS